MPSFLTRSLGIATIPAASSLKMQSDHLPHLADHSQSLTSTLRRTLSADMASEKWISQSGLKKVASVEHLHFHHDDNDIDIDNEAFEDIWSSIQRKQRNEEEEEMEKPRLQSSDIWSSILSQKANDQEEEANKGSVPYVHPLVRRSASTLSEKSLEICTESLGSETGSEGFSLSASDHEETKGDADAEEETETVEKEVRVSSPMRCAAPVMVQQTVKKAVGGEAVRSFPPPLPSLANRGGGSNVEMRSHRQDGRLVLEAVSVPTHACFRAERQDGRLLLTFSGSHVSGQEAEPDDVVTEQEEEVIYDEVDDVIEDEEVEDDYMQVGHALNPYVYSWRSKAGPAVVAVSTAAAAHLKGEMGMNKLLQVDRQYYGKSAAVEVVVEGKRAGKVGEDDLIPLLFKGCNLQQQLPKKSLLMWEHRCIAT